MSIRSEDENNLLDESGSETETGPDLGKPESKEVKHFYKYIFNEINLKLFSENGSGR